MAPNLFGAEYPGVNIFDVYNDVLVPRTNATRLPSGACNFVDLGPGANGARCGCRRFWARSAAGSPTIDEAGWCMCSHHACFHDHTAQAEASPDGRANIHGSEQLKAGQDPMSPMMALYSRSPTPMAGRLRSNSAKDNDLSFLDWNPTSAFEDALPIAAPLTQPLGSLPDTIPWDTSCQTHPNSDRFPPRSQSLASQTASTTSSAQARYLRPFGGKGLNTLAHVKPPAPSPLRTDQVPRPQDREGASLVFVSQAHASRGQEPTTQQGTQNAAAQNPVTRTSFQNLTDTVSVHDQRLNKLENVSFSVAGHEECHDKHDHMDLRVTDLESRVDELEKLGKSDCHEDASAQSVASFATGSTPRPSNSQDLYSQVQSLHAQVAMLQSAIPSYNHAWELEVVFLPFPLKRIWQGINNFKSDYDMSSDDWTQMPMTYSAPARRSQSPFLGEWASPEHHGEWLMPRACSVKSIVDRRLRSRGLVKTVSVTGPDARSVQIAIHSAFGSILREMSADSRSRHGDPRLTKFLGLQSSWVPLRKIHKDSRLRFLSPGEMLSTAMWDVQLLNSIMMRSSEPRLFITHPNAYLQDAQSFETGWTWEKVREMAKVHPDAMEGQEVPKSDDVLEGSWAWSENLDEKPDANPITSLRHQRLRSASPYPQVMATAGQASRSSSPALAAGPQSSILKGRRGSRPPNIRTGAVLPAVPASCPPNPSSGRRVSTSSHSQRSSPTGRNISQYAVMKRRRTRSPSHARFTPRWTTSPSPMPMAASDRNATRGTTPFNYATPHSNAPAPYPDERSLREGSVAPMMFEYHEKDDNDVGDGGLYEEEAEIYGSTPEEVPEERASIRDPNIASHAQSHSTHDSQHAQLPEDEPWPGIEDQEQLSNGENVDPSSLPTDQGSNASSQPSEYPSTQRRWPNDDTGFCIHED